MTAETKKKNIYETIALVMGEIGAIGKNDQNEQQKFMYRGIDAVMNAINPALIKYNLFIVPEVLEQIREERQTRSGGNLIYSICKIKYTFYAEDGSSISATVIGEGMDSGDKATNKAMSIAFKYACFQVFCIPTEEMVDPDAECHEVKPKATTKAPAQKKAAPKAEPKTEEQTEEQADKPVISEESKALRRKFVKYCTDHQVDWKKYGLNNDSTDQAFKDALHNAKAEVAERDGELPFELTDGGEE